jgi:hypothetical protein
MRLLILFAVLVMPLAMVNGGPAMASSISQEPAGHCEQMPEHKKDQPDRLADCAVACAAIPSQRYDIQRQTFGPSEPRVAALTEILHGLDPEAATPPPRFS